MPTDDSTPWRNEAQLRQRADRMMQRLRRDPLLYRSIREAMPKLRRQGQLGRQEIHEPWQILAEQRQAAMIMLGAIDDPRIVLRGDLGTRLYTCVAIADLLLRAEPFLWATGIYETATSSPLPKHVVSEGLMPHRSMYWSTEGARDVLPEREWENNWLLLTTGIQDAGANQPIVIIGDLVQPKTGRYEITFDVIRCGEIYPDSFTGIQLHSAGQILSQLAFLNSACVTTARVSPPRRVRKEMNRDARERGLEPPSEYACNVVELRREIRERISRDEAEREVMRQTREWQHHWWVSGHYRAQWMPSTQTHSVTWIAPYLKGPMDKPLLDRRLYVVDR